MNVSTYSLANRNELHSLSPATFLTKICIVSSEAADEARDEAEEVDETLPERCMVVE